MEQFLTDDELEQLTDYVRPSKQAEHCRKLGIPFFTNARGKPVVSRDAVSAKPAPKKRHGAGWYTTNKKGFGARTGGTGNA